ncbi:hypothetical protein RB595_002486 [Gaeumannomyces hyphopodioides]
MSVKRPRAAFEADLQAKQSPFVLFGTPLPPLDPDVRDDGSYVPVWKQEVRDERGRKRLHGAFTGGFSAGYFNTVGSKEGWTPSTFVSSRTNRRKDDPKAAQQRPEDFMDDEDLADAEESRKLQTVQDFAAFGSTEHDVGRSGGLAGLFRIEGETMGTKLLKRMGWKEGQGIGPKMLRKARLGVGPGAGAGDDQQATHLFAPEAVVMIKFVRKTDHKGLGFAGEARLAPMKLASEDRHSEGEDEGEGDFLGPSKPLSLLGKKTSKTEKGRGGIGMGVLNDTGSDDEDPYEMGPRISYNKVIGGDKKKKKKKDAVLATSTNPLLKSKPVFFSKRMRLGVKRCHDGRLPLDGFVLAQQPDPLVSEMYSRGKYPPPEVPPDWKSSRQSVSVRAESAAHVSTADAAKTSKLDPKSRATILGEKQLPGKSVFDFLSASARDRLVDATGNKNLPQAKGEIPAAYAMSAQEKLAELLKDVPSLDKATAAAAIARGASGGAPYADNEAKRSRYRAYLEYQAGFLSALPPKPASMSNDDWLREFHEFFNCARIFKPMSGFMASRFTTSSSATTPSSDRPGGAAAEGALISRPPPKPSDPAEEAARMGMFGPLTRSSHDFYPVRLLCKRFNVKPPAVVQTDADVDPNTVPQRPSRADAYDYGIPSRGPGSPSGHGDGGSRDGRVVPEEARAPDVKVSSESSGTTAAVDPTRNAALEKARAGEEVFKAVFGDSSDEEE